MYSTDLAGIQTREYHMTGILEAGLQTARFAIYSAQSRLT